MRVNYSVAAMLDDDLKSVSSTPSGAASGIYYLAGIDGFDWGPAGGAEVDAGVPTSSPNLALLVILASYKRFVYWVSHYFASGSGGFCSSIKRY
jgi:hypothetical protein